MSTEFQLVIQFPASSLADFDELVALEDRLIEVLGESTEVDGHDFGSSEFNIFVLTADPRLTFQAIEELLASDGNEREMRAGFRAVVDDDYVPLWPPGLTQFNVC